MSMTVISLSSWPIDVDTMWVGDQLDPDVVAAVGRTVWPDLVGMDEVTVAPSSTHGGYVTQRYGTLTIAIDAFARAFAQGMTSLWPPPRVLKIDDLAYYMDAITAVRPFFASGEMIAYRNSMSAEQGVVYALYQTDTYTITTKDYLYAGTLKAVFTAAASALGLGVNTTYARPTSPAVYYRADGDIRIIDALDAIARFFTHRFYIGLDGSTPTLFLVDMFNDNGALTLEDDEWERVEYTNEPPVSQLTAAYTQPFTRRLLLALDAVDGGSTSTVIAEVDVRSGVADLPYTAMATNTLAGYPVGNILDNNTATFWVSGTGTIPGTDLYIVITGGKPISEYTITSRAASPYGAPGKWRLYGWHEVLFDYYPLGEVSSEGWGALESRTFVVPPCAWPIVQTGIYTFGTVYAVDPTCSNGYTTTINALNNIENIINESRDRVRLALPVRGDIKIGQKITIVDRITCNRIVPGWTSGGSGAITQYDSYFTAWMHVDRVTYDFLTHSMVLEGEGVLS